MQELFEHAFSNFLESREYDETEDALFRLVRAAFYAGWQAAGGEVLPCRPAWTKVPTAKQIGAKENGKITGLF